MWCITSSTPGDLLGEVVVVDESVLRNGVVGTTAAAHAPVFTSAGRVETPHPVRDFLLEWLSRVAWGASAGCIATLSHLLSCGR